MDAKLLKYKVIFNLIAAKMNGNIFLRDFFMY